MLNSLLRIDPAGYRQIVGAQDLLLENLTTGQAIPTSATRVGWDPIHRNARWTFSDYPAGLPDGNYRATVARTGITDMAGNALLADVVFEFYVFAADATRDREVDFDDLTILAQNYNKTGGMTFDQGDFNYDGDVDFDDLAILAQRYNTALAPPPSPSPSPEPALSSMKRPAKRFSNLIVRG